MNAVTEPDTPTAAPVPAPRRLPARRWLRALALTLAPLLLFLALVSAGIGWLLNDEQGSRWLLRVLPGVTATGTSGSLLGEFSAERVEIVLPGAAAAAAHPDRIVIHRLSWSGVGLGWPVALSSWARLRFDRVQAERVDVQVASDPTAPPLALPASLALPIELDLRALQVGAVHVTALGEEPLRDLEAHLQLGADGGASHRIDGVAFAWDRVKVRGEARIGTAPPFSVDAQLALSPRETRSDGALAGFDATLTLAGPLDTLALKADLRGSGQVQGATAQSLALEATLKPFAPWPLATLAAQTQALDLAALYSGAPRTALSGNVTVDSVASDRPATVEVKLDNARAGRNDEGLLPVRSLRAELRARPDDVEQVEIRQLALEFGTLRERGGSITATGHWTPSRAMLDASFTGIAPRALDARAPPMRLGGSARLQADGWFAANAATAAPQGEPTLALRGRIDGELPQGGQTHKVQLDLDATATPQRIVLRQAALQAGAARAAFAGQAQQQAQGGWQVKGGGSLAQFNPALWWPGAEGSAWQSGAHRLNGSLDIDLRVPSNAAAMTLAQLARSQGQATLHITDSEIAGTPLAGELTLRGEGAAGLDLRGQLALASASADLKGRFAADANDHWDVEMHAPDLAPLARVLRLGQTAGKAKPALAGALDATTRIEGRWPAMRSQGSLTLKDARLADARLERAAASWTLGTLPQAPLDLQIELTQGSVGVRKLDSLTLAMKGTTAEHRIAIDAASPVRPPSWVDTLHGAAPRAAPSTGTRAELRAKGSLKFDLDWQQPAQWSLQLQQLQALRRGSSLPTPWFSAKGFDVVARYDPLTRTPQLDLSAGRAELTNMALRWTALHWRGGETPVLDVQAEVEPFSVAPLMARMQPEFGWGGDLVVGGKIDIHSAPSFVADIEFGRRSGDLSVTDEVETHKLELTDLRIALDARDGVWHFTHALAGRTLGAMAGAATVRTDARAIWPPADAPLQGVMELRIDDLAAWGAWVPAGWRLRGALHASASLGGLFGAPEFTGKVEGSRLGLRNLLEGIDLHDGELEIALQGDTAKIVKLEARGGDGKIEVSGGATFGESPQTTLRVVADKLLVLGRVDRQIVASGDATLKLDPKRLAVAGRLNVDKGLIDLSRGGAPTLASDVTVLREPTPEPVLAGPTTAAGGRAVDIELMLDLGKALRLRGRGLDTLLRGELKLTTPGGRLALHGTLDASRGTYAAYNQRLDIERGAVIFNGPPDNPRLDILALRPNLDIRVGVAVTGTAAAPRISLFSEPDLPGNEKLSWLVLGRAPDGLGGSDIALLQAAAAALLAGESESPTAQLTQLIGLDMLSVRQTEGQVRDTVVSVGKQLSRRWYIGYERSLSSTTGNWQLIYRLAQRFTLRLQTGIDNSIDLIWTWRWD
jgi:translocation and assembly module TamB